MNCEWKNCKLGDLITFQRGHDLPKYKMQLNGKYPVVGSNGIIGYNDEYTTNAPCITIGRSGNVGKPFLVNTKSWSHNTTLYIKEFKNVDPIFIYYFLKTLHLENYGGGSAVPTLNRNHIHPLDVCVPSSMDMQQKIAKILSALDDKIELNNRINKNLEEQAQALFKSWFVDFEPFGGVMPGDWKIGTLSDIADITMGQSPNGSSYNEQGQGKIFFQGRAEFGDRFPAVRLFTTEPKRTANYNDILLSVRAPVGDINIAHQDCCIGRGLAAIHSKTKHQSFVLYTMFSLKDKMDVFNGEGTVFGSINRESLNNMQILIPSIEKIEKFERIVEPIDALIRNNYNQICSLRQIRDTLLPKLMNGEIDVDKVEI